MDYPDRYVIALTPEIVKDSWPNLILGVNGEIDSLKDRPSSRYNCIAFALGEENVIVDMLILSKIIDLTPSGLDNHNLEHSTSAYISLFRHFYQFEICTSSNVEEGFTKIALYEGVHEDGEISLLHVALQKENGTWKSKLGTFEDIIHNNLDVLSGSFYGTPIVYMKRPKEIAIKIASV